MSRHFDETMTILILHYLRFGVLKILSGDNFVLRINQIIDFKQKIGCFIDFSIFPALSYSSFSHSLCIGWRTSGVWIELHIGK